uniref:Uncharacterized protein n=1 Tax=uncultured delta proteobacterium Rifle_16ft_4_minimus_37851 TaxID=1665181 RepID=A0A0H4TQC5_9DELT|nr:hypothetical protein [uncultured delta proteobacterium Rifle_16ft_4_minimus_37851]
MKGVLVEHVKVREDDGGIIEIKLWQVPPSHDKPHGYKYSLAYIVKGKRIMGYDNAESKGDHRHYRDTEKPYRFTDVDSLLKDFYNDVAKCKGGKL